MFSALTAATPGALQQSRQNYFHAIDLSLGRPVGDRLLIDKNPSYTFLIPALIRIFPELKLLIALRDPRDVVMSCFMQNLPLNQVGAACLTLKQHRRGIHRPDDRVADHQGAHEQSIS